MFAEVLNDCKGLLFYFYFYFVGVFSSGQNKFVHKKQAKKIALGRSTCFWTPTSFYLVHILPVTVVLNKKRENEINTNDQEKKQSTQLLHHFSFFLYFLAIT